MTMSELKYQMYNPGLRLEWQWEEAIKLSERSQGRKNAKAHELPLVNKAVKYLGDPTNRAYRDIKRAHEMSTEQSVTRCELNARILAGQNDDEVAEHVTALTSKQIGIYETLFFYVRARSKMTPWILKRTVRHRQMTGFDREDLGEFWCFVAISGGLKPLEHFIQLYRTVVTDDEVVDLSRYFGSVDRVPLSIQAFVANNMLASVPRTAKARNEIQIAYSAAGATTGPKKKLEAIDQCRRYTVIAALAYLTKQKIPTWRQYTKPSPNAVMPFKKPVRRPYRQKQKAVKRTKSRV